MSGQYIQINRKKYAVGLVWQPMVSGFTMRAYAYKLARGIDRKLNLYIGYHSLIGLAAHSRGARSGMPSIALEVMNALSEYSSFLAVFAVDKKFVLIAVRNGVILQDSLFDSEIVARAKYSEMSEIPDWNTLIAPAEWAMPRAVEKSLSDLISLNNHGVLRPISRFGSGILSLFILVLFMFVLLYVFREPLNQMFAPKPQISKIDPEIAEEYKRQIEEKNKELDQEFDMRQEPKPLVMPYELLPDSAERANSCYKGIAFLMQPITGWNQIDVECGETHVNVRFVRSFGTLDSFYELASEKLPGTLVQEVSDNEIKVQAKLPTLESVPSQDLRDVDTIVRELSSRFQAIHINANIKPVVDAVTDGVQRADLYLVEISAESKLIPREFLEIFSGFGGVYMTKVSWNLNRKIWNYEVIVYAK